MLLVVAEWSFFNLLIQVSILVMVPRHILRNKWTELLIGLSGNFSKLMGLNLRQKKVIGLIWELKQSYETKFALWPTILFNPKLSHEAPPSYLLGIL